MALSQHFGPAVPPDGGTIGERLRRCAAKASAGNPVMAKPLTAPPDWQSSHDYASPSAIGATVKTSSSKMYQLVVAGTSAAVEPSGTDEKLVYTDGTCKWRFVGALEPTVSVVDAPALTDFAGAPPSLTNKLTPTEDPSLQYIRCDSANYVLFRNNYFTGVNATLGIGKVGNVSTGDATYPGLSASQQRFSVKTDSPVVALYWPNGAAVLRVFVDGVPLWPGARLCGSGTSGNNGIKLDWSAASGRKVREITVEAPGNRALYGFYISDYGRFFRWSPGDEVKAAFLGDSYVAGGDNMPLDPGDSWAHVACKLLGWRVCNGSGVGGDGVSTAASGYYKYGERAVKDLFGTGRIVPQTPTAFTESGAEFRQPDVAVVQGSANDFSQPTLAADALALYQLLRSYFSGPIIWLGIVQTANGTAGVAATTEAAMFSLLPADDPTLFLVPVSTTDALNPQAWFAGTGHSGIGQSGAATVVGSVGDTNPALVSSDGTHLNPHGIRYFAERFAESVRQRILPNLK